MASVVDRVASSRGRPLFICDISPPRGGDPALLDPMAVLSADFLCVAYNPSRSVRVDPVICAYMIRRRLGRDVVFNLACRDMNRLALQSHLLGAHLLGLENLVVVRGDDLTERDRALGMKEVHDLKTTELLALVQDLNRGVDFRGIKLRAPTRFCVGSTLDLGKGMEREARLVHRKVRAGAQFFLSQPLYGPGPALSFLSLYRELTGEELQAPVFWGVQVLSQEGVLFGDVPPEVVGELEGGRPGTEIATEVVERFLGAGINTFYLVPPILKGGVRDYTAAQQVITAVQGEEVRPGEAR